MRILDRPLHRQKQHHPQHERSLQESLNAAERQYQAAQGFVAVTYVCPMCPMLLYLIAQERRRDREISTGESSHTGHAAVQCEREPVAMSAASTSVEAATLIASDGRCFPEAPDKPEGKPDKCRSENRA